MSKGQSGVSMTVYLSRPLYDWIVEQAADRDCTVNVWVRDALASLAPPKVAEAVDRAARGAARPAVQALAKPEAATPAPPPPPPPRPVSTPSFDELVEAGRDRVLELEARGYLENAIASITHLPFKVVQHILTTKAQPKKKRS